MTIITNFAVFFGKCTKFVMKLAGKQGSHFVGRVVKKIDPKIYAHIKKPKKVITVTGTNGKTTTTNILIDVITSSGQEISSNALGANLENGIITSLIDSSSLFGTKQKEIGVYEVDEQWSKVVYGEIKPDTVTITNLFQDSFERNANIYYIKRRIEEGIPKETKLILNAYDSISAYICPDNERVYFTVDILEGEKENLDSKIQDMIYCPNCDHMVEWDFKRYHHLGKYHCPNCGFKNPEAKYLVYGFDKENNLLKIRDDGRELTLRALASNVENIYNQIAAYATLRENGYSYEFIAEGMAKIKLTERRFSESRLGNKHFYKIVTKGYNPIAVTRALDTIRKSEKKKTVIWNIEDYWEKSTPVRTPGWIFSIDFKYIDDKVNKFIVLKSRNFYEIQLAAMIDGIPKDKLVVIEDVKDVVNYIDKDMEEEIYILHDFGVCDIEIANRFEKTIKDYISE